MEGPRNPKSDSSPQYLQKDPGIGRILSWGLLIADVFLGELEGLSFFTPVVSALQGPVSQGVH